MINKIPSKVTNFIKNKQWYHQRFDGAPMFIYPVAEAEPKVETRKPKGTEAKFRVCYFTSDGKGDWYLDQADIDRGAKILVKLAGKDKQLSGKLLSKWRRDEANFEKRFHKYKKIDVKKLSDKDLIKLFNSNYKSFIKRLTSSAIIDHFALGTDEMIAARLRREIGQIKTESVFTNIFSQATAPTRQSFINEAEMNLIRLSLKTKITQKDVISYCDKYFWTRNNYYTANILTPKEIWREIKVWQKNKKNSLAKLKLLVNTPKINQSAKIKLFKKYNFSQLTKTLLNISDDFTWWQDERKKSTYQNIHLGSIVLNELARRRKINPVLMKYLIPSELDSWFKGKITISELKIRQKGCVFVAWPGHFYITYKANLNKVKALMFPQKSNDKINDLRGLSASVGRVTGRVKIINSAREVGKVNKGDILVAVMTRPDYIAGIKKAAAVVTNEGGVTCHAAIVTRELGIPCIIGTKIATQVLKDGDLVDVNANHGVVKVINNQ